MPRTLFVGHSLVNTTMPQMLNKLYGDTNNHADYHVVNGASLEYSWEHAWGAEGVNARQVLPTGRYDNVILTEQIPTSGSLASHFNTLGTKQDALRFANLAWNADPDTRVMVYETWGYMGNQATWRANLTRDHAAWQGIADFLSARNPSGSPDVKVVPAGQAMAELYDTIKAGHGAGFDSIRELFSDNIHVNDTGNYFVALVQYAATTGDSPVGLSATVQKPWAGGPYSGWTPVQAALLQHIAWEAVAAEGLRLEAGTIRPVVRIGGDAANALTGRDGDDRFHSGGGADRVEGAGGRDLAFGGHGNDVLLGQSGNDWLVGEGGDDRVFGGAGVDRLSGGSGRDTLSGDTGNDALYGDGGADTFRFVNGSDADRVADFSLAQGDRLLLSRDLWAGSMSASEVVAAARLTSSGLVFNFGGGDSLTLIGVHTRAGLADAIDFI